MDTVKVKRQELLTRVQGNRTHHHNQFESAFEGFRKQAIEELERSLDRAKSGKGIQISIGLIQPEDHTRDYDRVIQMLTMSIDDEIELSSHDFDRYVMDRWEWSEKWAVTNARYTRG